MGVRAPDFSLTNEKGETVKLSSLKGKKVILYFYPKDHTPGCTQESCDFRDRYSKFKKLNVEIFGVSRDSVQSHLSFQQKQNLPFSLLADEDGKVCEAYGVWQEKHNYGKTYMGISRTTYLIDEAGKIAHVYPKVSVSEHVDSVLATLEGGGYDQSNQETHS